METHIKFPLIAAGIGAVLLTAAALFGTNAQDTKAADTITSEAPVQQKSLGDTGTLPATKSMNDKLPTMESPSTSGADTRLPATKAMDEATPPMEKDAAANKLPATGSVSDKLPTMESPATSGPDTRLPATKSMDQATPPMEKGTGYSK